jgi:site-specific recombinase XerD
VPIRVKRGKLEWRFGVDGHTYSHVTDLADTPRNRTTVMRMEAEARRLVALGQGSELKIQAEPFTSAAEAFINWARGEYSDHPNSWKRLRGSMTSASEFWAKRPLASLTKGDIEDYKSMRRTLHKVREVTIRHDLHALSLLFQYGMKHQWCRSNPIEGVEIPSDADAVRMIVLTEGEERQLFFAIDSLVVGYEAKRRTKQARALRDIRDLVTLMLNQGCRPEELRELPQAMVNLEKCVFTIQYGKSMLPGERCQ